MNFGTIRDSHLTVDLAGTVGPVGLGLVLVALIATGLASAAAIAVLVRIARGRLR